MEVGMQPRDASQPAGRTGSSDRYECGLEFDVARTLADVLDAWALVHDAYVRARLIKANRWNLHTISDAVRPRTVVIVGRISDVVASTMSCYLDDSRGLPLDQIYPQQMNGLRRSGRLMEVGLFADRREKVARSFNALLQLMRYTFFYAVHSQVSDIVIGVNPHHAKFYERLFGFERFAEDSTCPSVNHAPLVPLRLDIPNTYLEQGPLPKGLAFFRSNPMDADAFAGHYAFDCQEIARSPIAEYLAEHREAAYEPMGAS
jgi:hypothetical protein